MAETVSGNCPSNELLLMFLQKKNVKKKAAEQTEVHRVEVA
jgi:hypothetical protein